MTKKKEISPEERFERAMAIDYWNNVAKPYIEKKRRKGYKTDPNARSSQVILDELYKYKAERDKTIEDHKSGKITGPEKHEIDNKLYRKIKLLEKELKALRL